MDVISYLKMLLIFFHIYNAFLELILSKICPWGNLLT